MFTLRKKPWKLIYAWYFLYQTNRRMKCRQKWFFSNIFLVQQKPTGMRQLLTGENVLEDLHVGSSRKLCAWDLSTATCLWQDREWKERELCPDCPNHAADRTHLDRAPYTLGQSQSASGPRLLPDLYSFHGEDDIGGGVQVIFRTTWLCLPPQKALTYFTEIYLTYPHLHAPRFPAFHFNSDFPFLTSHRSFPCVNFNFSLKDATFLFFF